ncbi:MAG: hypothetical protein EX268_19125 [Deltaproteobacteria bacterium]|nr:MAG: hypothetical protein EX268_19125 [Deltaproteobacteria bacterium]
MGGSTGPEARVIVTHGRTVRLLDVSGGTIVEVDSAEIPAAGLLGGHQIYGAVQQAGQQRIYVGSSNDCAADIDWCWGNGRIDRFTFTKTDISYDGVAYEMNDAAFQQDGISCAQGDELFTGYTGQEGSCAPRGFAFSPDGTRFYVQEDANDIVEIFSVDAGSGDLSFVAEGGATDLHGLSTHPNGTYLYNGTYIFDITGDAVLGVAIGAGGNGTEVVPSAACLGTTDLLVTSISYQDFAIYDLTDPESPLEIDAIGFFSDAPVRAQAHNDDCSRFVLAGKDEVRTVSFDGVALTLEDELITTGGSPIQNRDVAVTGDDGELAVVAYFRGGNGNPTQAGGVVLYGIDIASGALTQLDTASYASGPGRVALSVTAE